MDHTQAIEKQAAERYLLGELSASEAEDFERHFFECTDCADAVDAGGSFIEGARVALRRPLPADPQRAIERRGRAKFLWWPQGALACAAAVLAAVVVYETAFVIPGLRQAASSAQVLPAFQLAGATRGEAAPLQLSRAAPFVSLAADIPPEATYPKYVCTLTSGGRTIFRVMANAPEAGQPITVLAPTKGLDSGSYELTISGIGADQRETNPVVHYMFQFQFH